MGYNIDISSVGYIITHLRTENYEIIFALTVAFLLLPSLAHADQLQDAKTAYEDGDYPSTLNLLRPLAEHGNATAQNWLGEMYELGMCGLKEDPEEAARWFQKALKHWLLLADQGNAEAQYMLGLSYERMWGVKQDYKKSVAWIRKAADQGFAPGQFMLGVYYATGAGVKQNPATALKWYRKAAEQGDAEALQCIGSVYNEGIGVEVDYAEAQKWYRMAADQNNSTAQFALGLMYQDGLGVKQDYAEAYYWSALSESSAHRPPPRPPTKWHLTSEQIAAIDKRVASWKPTPALHPDPEAVMMPPGW